MSDPVLILLASSGSILLAIVAFLTWNQNRGKTHADVVATQNATISAMSARLDAQGARMDAQSDTIDGLRKDLKTRDAQLIESQNETKQALQKLSESEAETATALLKLDHLPEKVAAQEVEIARLIASAKAVEDTNLASAHARETTANTAAQQQKPGAAPHAPAEADSAQEITVTTPAEIHIVEKPQEPTIENGEVPGEPRS